MLKFIFGGSVDTLAYPEYANLILYILSTIAILFVVGLPFIVVFKILKLIMGR